MLSYNRPAQRRNADNGVVAPRLLITRDAWNRLHAYVTSPVLKANEINGFGYVTRTSDGNFLLDTVFITRQVVTPGSAEYTGYDAARALDRAYLDGRSDDMWFQWHSHGQLDAYHSPTDMANIRAYGEAAMQYVISMVTNVYGHVALRIDSFQGFHLGGPMEWSIVDAYDDSVQNEVDAEISKLVTIQKPKKPRVRSRTTTRRSAATS